jgi:TetR/AcrR family transcriptional repressor of nem operon
VTGTSTAARTRALTPKGAATRARIVAAAADAIFERGVARTSLDDVCAAARVGKSQLYHYFADKDALVAAVIRHQTENVLDNQGQHYSRLTTWADWEAWIDHIVSHQVGRHCVGGCPLGSLGSELADGDERARAQLVDGFARWEGGFRDGLTEMRRHGDLREDADPAALATFMLGALQGGLLLTQVRKDEGVLRTCLEGALAYIRGFERPSPNEPGNVRHSSERMVSAVTWPVR